MQPKMLITGVSGLLGNNLAHYFRNDFEILGLFNKHPVVIPGVQVRTVDLANKAEANDTITAFAADIVIHCGSLTKVDYCEQFPQKALEANVTATQYLIDAISPHPSTKLIYISTDSVYGGVKDKNQTEDKVGACNVYGETKLKGEQIVGGIDGALVLRTNIFGWNIQEKCSLAEWMINEFRLGNKINGFNDARFSSIYTFELARIIKRAIDEDLSGVYNCGSRDSCTKFEFATRIAKLFGFDQSLIHSISIDQHDFLAKRGKDLSFSVEKIEKDLDISLPTIDFSLEQFYRDHKAGIPDEIKKGNRSLGKAFTLIPYGRQAVDWNDIVAVNKVLLSTNLTQGPKVTAFEEALRSQTGAPYAVAVNSGTSALHIACMAAGVKSGDEVITSPNTFVASANCAVFCGAKPVFADIDPKTYNIDPQEIKNKISEKTKAIIPVHFAGQSADMEEIVGIVRDAEKQFGKKIFIIEDASHALGSKYKNTEVGSCFYSDMVVLSFHPVKHITTGEGGAVLSKNSEIQEKLRRHSSHGITRNPELLRDNHGPWYYEQIDLGYNYRITDIQSVLGVSQMEKMPKFKKRRREIVDRYNRELKGIPLLELPFESEDCDSNFHLYVILYDYISAGTTRNQFKDALYQEDILTQIHYIPVHTQPYFQSRFNTKWGDCPNAESYFEKCLSIPLYPAMTDEEVSRVVRTIRKICGA